MYLVRLGDSLPAGHSRDEKNVLPLAASDRLHDIVTFIRFPVALALALVAVLVASLVNLGKIAFLPASCCASPFLAPPPRRFGCRHDFFL